MRFLDIVFLFYFVIHIPIAIFIDSQAIFPQWMYPKVATDLVKWYCKTFKDSMMLDTPAWFQSFVYCEMFLQLPFFFIAARAFIQGIQRCPWIRSPMLIYAANAGTTTFAILFNVFLPDPNHPNPFGTLNFDDKLKLTAIYCPFLIMPIMLIVDFCFREFEPRSRTHND